EWQVEPPQCHRATGIEPQHFRREMKPPPVIFPVKLAAQYGADDDGFRESLNAGAARRPVPRAMRIAADLHHQPRRGSPHGKALFMRFGTAQMVEKFRETR